MYHVSAQGVDERMINVHYYYMTSCVGMEQKGKKRGGGGGGRSVSPWILR